MCSVVDVAVVTGPRPARVHAISPTTPAVGRDAPPRRLTLKLKYASQVAARPPTFVMWANANPADGASPTRCRHRRTRAPSSSLPPSPTTRSLTVCAVPVAYQRFLSNALRAEFSLQGVPVRVTFKRKGEKRQSLSRSLDRRDARPAAKGQTGARAGAASRTTTTPRRRPSLKQRQ